MEEDKKFSDGKGIFERWFAIQREALEDSSRVARRMSENLRMGSYTPQSFAGDVVELWSVALRGGTAAVGAVWGAASEAPTRSSAERVIVVEVPRGVEGWQFNVDIDSRLLPEGVEVTLATTGFRSGPGGFALEDPRNVSFDPPQLERGELGVLPVSVALFSLPQSLPPGCYCGRIEARPYNLRPPVMLTEVHVHVAERGEPSLQHPTRSSEIYGSRGREGSSFRGSINTALGHTH